MTLSLCLAAFVCVASLCLSTACGKKDFDEPQQLGGVSIAAEILNRGDSLYRQHCADCHGMDGRGQTTTADTLRPRPRDLTLGLFKYKSTPDDRLPTDADLFRTIQMGLTGTQMASFLFLRDAEIDSLVHFIKTFSDRWRTEEPGPTIRRDPDPWVGRDQDAAAEARGEIVYHGAAQCWACHPAYMSRLEISGAVAQIAAELGEQAPVSLPFRGDLTRGEFVDTEVGRVLPPDFLSVIPRAGRTASDLYRTIGAGVGGTPMPTWQNQLSPRDLWALVHYVDSLLRLRETPEAAAIRQRVN